MMKEKPIARTDNLLTQATENELLIYDLNNHRAVCLNETAALVWRECDGTKTLVEISELMSIRHQTLIGEELVRLTLSELSRENLIENGGAIGDLFAGLSRREVIKKVGLASMVALPIVSSIVAPNATLAQSSLLPLFAACSTSPECASGLCWPSAAFGRVCCASTTTSAGFAPGTLLGTVPCSPNCAGAESFCCSGTVMSVTTTFCSTTGQFACQCT